jgi:hypothetical protein
LSISDLEFNQTLVLFIVLLPIFFALCEELRHQPLICYLQRDSLCTSRTPVGLYFIDFFRSQKLTKYDVPAFSDTLGARRRIPHLLKRLPRKHQLDLHFDPSFTRYVAIFAFLVFGKLWSVMGTGSIVGDLMIGLITGLASAEDPSKYESDTGYYSVVSL